MNNTKTTYDLIGDVHGCFDELNSLCAKLGYDYSNELGFFVPTPDRMAIFVGDLIDRGPDNARVFDQVMTWIRMSAALCVRGNHDDKFARWCRGKNVIINHGLQTTIDQINDFGWDRSAIAEIIELMPQYLSLDAGRLIVVHAAWHEGLKDFDPLSKSCRSYCLYGPTTGLDTDGMPRRIDWVAQHPTATDRDPIIVYGHAVYDRVRIFNKTYGIDTGCVFGGSLSCLSYPQLTITSVRARSTYASLAKI